MLQLWFFLNTYEVTHTFDQIAFEVGALVRMKNLWYMRHASFRFRILNNDHDLPMIHNYRAIVRG